MADLFDLVDLPSWLQVPQVDTETATRVRRVVNGWLQDATGLSVWPDPVPDRLWAWAVELAGIAYRNPGGDVVQTTGAVSTQFGDRVRRTEILVAARRAYNTALQPVGSFPEPDWSWETTTTSSTTD